MQIHATVVSVDGKGVVLRGPSASGKSDLALRLIDCGALLVADDRCDLVNTDSGLMASAPDRIAGLLEVRGLGVYRLEHASLAPVALVVDLTSADTIERLPEPATCTDWGPSIPCIKLAPFEASAPAKIRLALDLEPVS